MSPRQDPTLMGDIPPVTVHHPHVEARPDILAGSPIVRGTMVAVRRIYAWHRKGVSVETLIKRYPQLGPAKVLDALAFAYDNLDLLDADIERERDMLDAEHSKTPALPHTRPNRRAPLTGARTEQWARHDPTKPCPRTGCGRYHTEFGACGGDE